MARKAQPIKLSDSELRSLTALLRRGTSDMELRDAVFIRDECQALSIRREFKVFNIPFDMARRYLYFFLY